MTQIAPMNVRSTLAQHILADGFNPVIDLEKSHDSWLVDQVTGNEYLDMFSMFASGAVGYNHPKVLEQKEVLSAAAVHKPTLSDIYCDSYAEFLQVFHETAIPEYLPHAFFIEGGALAVENALKVAFDWKTRLNLTQGINVEGSQIIHFTQAFHGRSGYTLSLTNTDPNKVDYFPKFNWPRITNPALRFPVGNGVLEEAEEKEAVAIDQINTAITENPNKIAALIIEPIQGEGGDNHFRDEFFVKLREICDENKMLFILDEVQTGVGITGKMWCHEHNTVNPDIISFGKKSQVCGLLAGRRIDEVENNVFQKSGRINSTFGGNLTDMVRFRIILEIIRDEQLLDNAEKKGFYLQKKLQCLSEEFPGFVTNPRGKGLFCAFDLPSQTERDEAWQAMMDNGLLILPSGEESIRFRPHLTVTEEEIDKAVDLVETSIRSSLN